MAENRTRQEIFEEVSAQSQEALHTHLRELKLLGIEPGKETYLYQVQRAEELSTTLVSGKTSVETDLQIINTAQAIDSAVGATSGVQPTPYGVKSPSPTSLKGTTGGVVETASTVGTIDAKLAYEGYHVVFKWVGVGGRTKTTHWNSIK